MRNTIKKNSPFGLLADYGLSLAIEISTGEQYLMSMNTEDFFPVATPEAFADLMRAKATGGDAIISFLSGNENFQRYKSRMSARDRQLASYESQTYNSLNSFYENLQARMEKSDISFNMQVTFAEEGDVVENAAIPWSSENKTLTAAVLHLDSISLEADGQCDRINYDPMILGAGIEPSDDPILQARRNVYAITFGKRLSQQ